jgi:hypothetical protein
MDIRRYSTGRKGFKGGINRIKGEDFAEGTVPQDL